MEEAYGMLKVDCVDFLAEHIDQRMDPLFAKSSGYLSSDYPILGAGSNSDLSIYHTLETGPDTQCSWYGCKAS